MNEKRSDQRPLSPYEKINPFKIIPYWMFWIFIGVLAFSSSEAIIRAFDEKRFLPFIALRIIMSIVWAGFPIILTWMSHNFFNAMHYASDVFWKNTVEFTEWLEERQIRIFTFRSGYSKLIAVFIGISVTLTYSLNGMPLQNTLPIIYFLTTGTILAIMGGQTAYVVIDLLVTLAELIKKDAQIPFFRLPHPAITRVQNYYATAALFSTAGYISLVVAGMQSPYGLFHPGVITWLSVLAFFPLALFVLSSYQIHVLMVRIKQSQLEMVNDQIQKLFLLNSRKSGIKTYDQLEKAMNIQTKIQSMPEWPLSLTSIFSFLVTAATAIIQIVIPLINALKP